MVHVSDILLTRLDTTDEMRDTTTSEFTDEGTKRKGPKVCSSRKVFLFAICSIISAGCVVGLVYYFRPSFSKTKILNFYTGSAAKEELPEEILQRPNLPENLTPKYYRLRFEPDFNGSFTAQATITIQCKQPTNQIVLHAENLNFSHIEMTTIKFTTPKNLTKHARSEILRRNIEILDMFRNYSKVLIKLGEVLAKDERYYLNINYSGVSEGGEFGFVDREYSDEFGDRKKFISTKTQPIYARNIFPCFDEFGFDAQFEISILKRTDMVALSNTFTKDTEASNKYPGFVWDHFETTSMMPARQIAFAIASLKSLEVPSKKPGPVVKMWTRKPLINRMKHLAKFAADFLDFFRDYFSVNCPLKKLDFVLVPHLGKEVEGQLGLIFLRESTFVFNANVTDGEFEKRAFELISEAVVKQWLDAFFSDNWTELLLQQGLAKYLVYISQTALINPSRLDNFGLEIVQPTLLEDAVAGINIAKEIKEQNQFKIFDASLVNKIASIYKMTSEMIGGDEFRNELIRTLKERNQTNLLNSLADVNPVAEKVLMSFLNTSGFPLITVKRKCSVTIEQLNFGSVKSSPEKWIIPLSYIIRGESAERHEILDQGGLKINNKCLNNSWILFNQGYYRVNYDIENWNALTNQLIYNNISEIPLINRVQLINDAFELANFGYLEHRIPFQLLAYLRNERNFTPWKAALNSLAWIESVIVETQHFGKYKNYILDLLDADEVEYNFTETNPINALKINKICLLRFKSCTSKAKAVFDKFYMNKSQELIVLPQFKYMIYCLGVSSGLEEVWDFIWEKSKNASEWEKQVMYSALGCSRETWKLTSYLQITLNGSINPQYTKLIWQSMGENPVGRLVGLNFLETKWNDVYKAYKHNHELLEGIITEFLNRLATEIDLKKVAMLYNKHKTDLKPFSKLMKITLTKIKARVSWKEKFFSTVLPILSNNGIPSDID